MRSGRSMRSGFSDYEMTSMRSDDYQRYGKRKKPSACKQFMMKVLFSVLGLLVLFVSIKILIYVQFPKPFQDSAILTEEAHLNFVKQMLYQSGRENKTRLLYRASREGYTADAFHN